MFDLINQLLDQIDIIFVMRPQTIKKAVVYNLILGSFFLSDNLSTFIGIILIVGFLFFPSYLVDSIPDLRKYEQDCSPIDKVNNLYTRFIKKDLIIQLSVLVLIKFIVDFIWLFQSWFLAVLIVEYLVAYDELKDLGIINKVENMADIAIAGIKKVLSLIPKHKSSQAN